MRFRIDRLRFFRTLIVVVFAAILFGNLSAQPGTSTITGVVTDQTGAVVPGVQVTIRNPAMAFARNAVSDKHGNYGFPGIPPANYLVEVTAGNFNKATKNNVRALVDLSIEVNFVLVPEAVRVTVDVTRKSIESVINTQDASIGNIFVSEQITQLPTNLRRVNDLLTLQPGVTRHGYVAGGRSDQTNITLDGVDINDQQTGGRIHSFQTAQDSALRVTTESIEEFRITTTNPNANLGRSSGAQISMVTRSGSNEWHGAGFYFFRPTKWSANDFFNNAIGRYESGDRAVLDGAANAGDERVPRAKISRDVFGGRIGGPVIKDRAFFFYSYEGQRQDLEKTVVRLVPLAHMGQGQLRFTGTGPTCDANNNCTLNTAQFNAIYNQVGINPVAVALFADVAGKYPANDFSEGDGINTAGFRWNAPATISQNTHIARFDLNLTENQQLFIRGNYQWDHNSGISRFPDTPQAAGWTYSYQNERWHDDTIIEPSASSWSHPYGWALGHNWTISANRTNNFRWGFTRQAFSDNGDSDNDRIGFDGVFTPLSFKRSFSRVTETHNFTDDFIWIDGDHIMQLGGNVRIIRNRLENFGRSFGSARIGTPQPGEVAFELTTAGYFFAPGQTEIYETAAAALIGRYSGYSADFSFDIDGSVLPVSSPSVRNFATEEYDAYIQDIWRPRRDLTITYGLRYGLSRPVYEKNGFQVVPAEPLGDFFDCRVAASQQGIPLNDPIEFRLGGPVNNAPGFYEMDTNNLQPRLAVAWSPSFESGFWRKLFGATGTSVLRGGFAITHDNFGQQLAASFDEMSRIGFTMSVGCCDDDPFDVTNNPGPLFTGFDQDIRSFPGIPVPANRFAYPVDEAQRIETSLDATIVSPVHYTWNVSYGRSLPKEMYFEASYIGRAARNLFAARDVMAFNNLVDPQSGMDWYTAAGMLVDAQQAGVPITSLAAIPYFENLFPNAMAALGISGLPANNNTQAIYGLFADDGLGFRDYTLIQLIIDDATAFNLPVDPGIYPNMFLHPQYGALTAFGTTAYSDYHGGSFTLKQRLGNTLSYDINYTFSKSMDNASGLRTGGSYGSQFILNSLRPDDNYSVSDFDTKHVVNANFIFQLPVGKRRTWFSGMNAALDAVFGGWQLAGVYRWNTGRPISAPFDYRRWATNWQIPSRGVRLRPVDLGVDRNTQNAFDDPQAALNSFRNARPGETGDRNAFRRPGYQVLDLGLTKNFKMPYNENHSFQFRWEVFNVTNTQYFNPGNISGATFGLPQDAETATANANFGRIYNSIQGRPRSMQFGLRYEF